MFFSDPEQQEDGMGREGRDYWVEQLAEYWEVSAQRLGSARFRKSVETWA